MKIAHNPTEQYQTKIKKHIKTQELLFNQLKNKNLLF
jgi:hypothetical protein